MVYGKGYDFLPKMVYKRVMGWIWGGDSYKTLLNAPPPSPAEQWTNKNATISLHPTDGIMQNVINVTNMQRS